jgi:DNA mismatch repair protein PMS2
MDATTTAAALPTIQAIPADSVRRIVAGQVIFDLASAVKELVDNALDAQSTSINST